MQPGSVRCPTRNMNKRRLTENLSFSTGHQKWLSRHEHMPKPVKQLLCLANLVLLGQCVEIFAKNTGLIKRLSERRFKYNPSVL
jgi:hypothetical protein